MQPEGHEFVRALPLGVVANRAISSPCLSRFMRQYPGLIQSICACARKLYPNFTFTSIQPNAGYSARLHIDGNNRGPSLVAGFGDYKKGRIFIYDYNGSCAQTLLENMRGWPFHQKGDKVPGDFHDVRHGLVAFDGKAPHSVEPFVGTRYSMVLFTNSRWRVNTADASVANELKALGFN